MGKLEAFEKDIAEVLKRHALDNYASMPAHILAKYVTTTLAAIKSANDENRLLQNSKTK